MTDYYKDIDVEFKPREKYGPRFTATDVRAYRDQNSCGMMQAKNVLMSRQMLADLNKGRRSHDTVMLYDILEYMLENRFV